MSRRRRSAEPSKETRCWKIFDETMIRTSVEDTRSFEGSYENCRKVCRENYPLCTGILYDNFARNAIDDCFLLKISRFTVYQNETQGKNYLSTFESVCQKLISNSS